MLGILGPERIVYFVFYVRLSSADIRSEPPSQHGVVPRRACSRAQSAKQNISKILSLARYESLTKAAANGGDVQEL